MRLPALLLLIAATLIAGCADHAWREVFDPAGGFSADMRGEVRYRQHELDTHHGRMVAHLYYAEGPSGVLAVGYSDYPLALVLATSREEIFANVRDTWVKRIDGRLTRRDSQLALGGQYPGIEFVARGTLEGEDAFVQARLFLVDQRLYQVVAMGRTRDVPQGRVNRFLNSFRHYSEQEVGELRIELPLP